MGGQPDGCADLQATAGNKAQWDGRFAGVDARVQELAAHGLLTPALGDLYRAALEAEPQAGHPGGFAAWVDAVARAESAAAHVSGCAAFSASRTVWWLALYELAVLVLAAWGGVREVGVHGAGSAAGGVAVLLAAVGGAAVYSLYSLCVGTLHRTLDRDALLWYVVKPMTGGVMGAFAADVARLLAQSATGAAPGIAHGGSAWLFPALVAFFGGYNERFAAQLMEVFGSRVTGSAFRMGRASAKSVGEGTKSP